MTRNPKAIKACRKPYCELCGSPAYGEPHHIISRGAGGPDHPLNLIQLCGQCHVKAHMGKIARMILLAIISKRYGMAAEQVLDAIYALMRGEAE